jgi:opacity protein-like surface antigen
MNRLPCGALLCAVLSCTIAAPAQHVPPSAEYSRKNTFTLFAEYSNTSSHILLGASRQRELADFGGAYTRRLVRFRGTDFSYQAEIRPILFESDPVEIETNTLTVAYPPPVGTVTSTQTEASAATGTCTPISGSYSSPVAPGEPTVSDAYSVACGRQWTFGQAFSPLGFKYSLRTRHRLQPFFVGTLGYMYTSRPVPVADAEAFNFIFNFGVGIELFRSASKNRSISLEYRFNHFSNRDTAAANPGTDNMLYKLSYSFGR